MCLLVSLKHTSNFVNVWVIGRGGLLAREQRAEGPATQRNKDPIDGPLLVWSGTEILLLQPLGLVRVVGLYRVQDVFDKCHRHLLRCVTRCVLPHPHVTDHGDNTHTPAPPRAPLLSTGRYVPLPSPPDPPT